MDDPPVVEGGDQGGKGHEQTLCLGPVQGAFLLQVLVQGDVGDIGGNTNGGVVHQQQFPGLDEALVLDAAGAFPPLLDVGKQCFILSLVFPGGGDGDPVPAPVCIGPGHEFLQVHPASPLKVQANINDGQIVLGKGLAHQVLFLQDGAGGQRPLGVIDAVVVRADGADRPVPFHRGHTSHAVAFCHLRQPHLSSRFRPSPPGRRDAAAPPPIPANGTSVSFRWRSWGRHPERPRIWGPCAVPCGSVPTP